MVIRSFLLAALLLLMQSPLKAQSDKTKGLGLNLETIQYPFPVRYISLSIQGENLKMAYMSGRKSRTDGRSSCYMGKISTELILNRPPRTFRTKVTG